MIDSKGDTLGIYSQKIAQSPIEYKFDIDFAFRILYISSGIEGRKLLPEVFLSTETMSKAR